MPVRTLTDYDYGRLAHDLGLPEPETLMAVGQVESRGDGFYPDGFPTILFERHKFYKHARRDKRDEWFKEFPAICNPRVTPKGGYGSKGDQRIKFSQAFKLDADAAMMACSWGAFQELGENYDDYDFHTVGEFVDMMKSGIAGQLEIFARSIRKRGLIDELKRKDFAGFARNYNGPNFHEFAYDRKMHAEYESLKRRRIDWQKVMAAGLLAQISDDDILEFADKIAESPATQIGLGASELAALPERESPARESVADPGAGANPGPGQEQAPAPPGRSGVFPTVWQKVDAAGDKFVGINETLGKFGVSNPLASTSVGTYAVTFTKLFFGGLMAAAGVLQDHWQYILLAALLFSLAAYLWHQSRKRVAEEKAGVPISILEKMVK